MTGTTWVEESGFLEGPIAITNTHSVGVVRDAIIGYHAIHFSGGSGAHVPDPLTVAVSSDDGQTWVDVPDVTTLMRDTCPVSSTGATVRLAIL